MQLEGKEQTDITPIDKKLLEEVVSKLLQDEESADDPKNKEKIRYLHNNLQRMKDSSDSWLSSCPFNYYFLKSDFVKILHHYKREGKIDLDDVLLMFIRFYKEYIMHNNRQGKWLDNDIDFQINKLFYKDLIDLNNLREKRTNQLLAGDDGEILDSLEDINYHIEYIKTGLASDVINFYLSSRSYQAFLNYEENIKSADFKLASFQIELNKAKEETEKMTNILNEQKTAFNFVGLSKAFEKLLKNKESSKSTVLKLLFTMGLLTSFPLVYQACNVFNTSNFQFDWKNSIPIIGLELIMIYFFRVLLSHYHSIQTQIMQLELRQSLCQFIQNYVEYAKDMRGNGDTSSKDTLDKFESLIFSSILSNPDKVPGTFDGIEGLSTFLEALKK